LDTLGEAPARLHLTVDEAGEFVINVAEAVEEGGQKGLLKRQGKSPKR